MRLSMQIAGALAMAFVLNAETSTMELTLGALEAYRNGDCKTAVPKLETLLARQPKNRHAQQLLQSCREGLSSSPKTTAVAPPPSLNAPPVAPAAAAPKSKAGLSPEAAERHQAGADFDKAERLIKAGHLNDAEALIAKVIKAHPDLMLPRQRQAEIYTRRKEPGKAAEMYLQMAARSKDASYLRRAAENYSWDRNYDAALEIYDRYVTAAPNDRPARIARANTLLWSNHLPKAVAAFQEIVTAAPDDIDARQGLAHALLWSKQFGPALQQFEWLKKKKPSEVIYRTGAAEALAQLDRPADALAEYDAVLAADPGNKTALQGRAGLETAVELRRALQLAEKGSFAESAAVLERQTRLHPSDAELTLQLARVEFWGERYPNSARHYRTYLKMKPADEQALRELARVELSVPDYAAAQQHYEQLATRRTVQKDDIEGLIAAYIWDNKHDAAEPWAQKLAAMEPGSVTAADTLRLLSERRKIARRETAQKLASEGKFPEAVDAYRDMTKTFGSDRESMLSIARLYGWDKQLPRSIAAYQEYLNRYPADTKARIELGQVQGYAGDYESAKSTYRSVLQKDRNNGQALLGLAQAADRSGQDPFRVADAYRSAFQADPKLRDARSRYNELIPEMSPSIGYRQKNFGDSDGFRRGAYSVEGSIPMRGGVRITPYYLYNDFSQFRRVGGGDCGGSGGDPRASRLSDEICSGQGVAHGHTGGFRFSVSPDSRVSFTADASQSRFDLGRNRLNAQADLNWHPTNDSTVTFGYARREAVYDVNTVGALYAGVLGESFFAAYRQPVSAKWEFSAIAGYTRYDEGTSGLSTATQQRRGSASVTYRVTPSTRAGYFMRLSSYTNPTPVFFSPSLYAVAGATYDWNKRLSESLSLIGASELGFGRMKRFETAGLNVTEFSLYLGLGWRIRPDLSLQLGYRLSRGVSSAFGSPTYRTNGVDFGLNNYFARPLESADPGRIEVR